VLTWTPGFHNVKIARNEVISCSCVESKELNVSSVMGLTNLKIIVSSAGVVKLTQRRTPLALKQRKVNHVLIHSNVLTVKATIKQTQTHVPFGDIDSTESGTRRSMLRSMKTGPNQFVQLWTTTLNNDLWLFKSFFSECPKEFANYQYHPWDLNRFWHHFHLRTAMVCHLHDTKCLKSRRQNCYGMLEH